MNPVRLMAGATRYSENREAPHTALSDLRDRGFPLQAASLPAPMFLKSRPCHKLNEGLSRTNACCGLSAVHLLMREVTTAILRRASSSDVNRLTLVRTPLAIVQAGVSDDTLALDI